mmetsp:Transcript_27169/g.45448  ORF Transcript_27169/g.45448 Transcript_27169/m.45448 type:complete len:272 (+) Transcript_27169:1884-2699(+)
MHALYLGTNRLPLCELGLEHHVGAIVAAGHAVGGHHRHRQIVNGVELRQLSLRSASHARELGVGQEEALVGDAGKGDGLVLDGTPLLGLHRLMQALAPSPPLHGASGELIHNNNLVLNHDVVDVTLLKLFRLEGVDEVDGPLLPRVVQIRHLKDVLRHLIPLLIQQNGLLLLVHLVVHLRRHGIGDLRALDIALGGLLRLAADDEGGARLVDEDAVHLVHDAEVEVTKHQLLRGLCQVVAQVIEAELTVGDVCDVRLVRRPALVFCHARLH